MATVIYHPQAWLRLLPADFDPEHSEYPEQLPEETAWVLSDFLKNGRNIFHIEPELVQLFDKTPIDELILEDIKLPFEAFYIYFGEAAGIYAPEKSEEGDEYENSSVFIEGAYISRSTHTFRGIDEGNFWISLVPSFEEYMSEEEWSYHFDFEHHADPRGFIRPDLKTKILDQYLERFTNFWERTGELEYHRANKATGSAITTPFHELRDNWKPDEKDIAWKESALKALRIVINTIAYLTTDECDLTEDYPASYPRKLVAKAIGDNKKQAARAVSKLESLGYRKVRFLGRSFKRSLAVHQFGNVSPHWRRGHWRRQPHGKRGEELRKLIWIKPTIVNPAGGPNPDTPGHVYDV